MGDFNSIAEILDFAIEQEEQAWHFYNNWGRDMSNRQIKTAFAEFASEELNHKAKLESIKMNPGLLPRPDMTTDLKIARYLVDESTIKTVDDDKEPDLQKAFLLAIAKEKAAFRLYQDLEKKVQNEEYKNIFKMLAQEEAIHKLKLELEYDAHFMPEN